MAGGSTTALRVAAVVDGTVTKGFLGVPGCEVRLIRDESDLSALLDVHPCDCVLFVASNRPTEAKMAARLQEICDERIVPFVLAGWSDRSTVADLLVATACDGFVDLRWSQDLKGAAIDAALRRFQIGRNIVDIQRRVLDSAQGEFAGLRDLVFMDDLTCLYNLRYFREIIAREHARCMRHQRTYTMVYMDLDGLKQINSEHGHAAGGRMLVAFGETVARITRASDYAFRVGGDEFVSLIVESTKAGGRVYAEKICEAWRATEVPFGGARLRLTVSVGVASFPQDGDFAEQVLERADAAVYQAKSAGRDRVCCWDG